MGVTTKLFLCRHAKTVFNAKQIVHGPVETDISLDHIHTVDLLGARFAGIEPDLLLTSTLTRSVRTSAGIVCPTRRALPALNEMSFGGLEGQPLDHADVERHLSAMYAAWSSGDTGYRLHGGGESYCDVESRMRGCIEEAIRSVNGAGREGEEEGKGSSVVVVGHMRALTVFLSSVLDHLGAADVRRIVLENCSVSELLVRDNGDIATPRFEYSLVALNDVSHL